MVERSSDFFLNNNIFFRSNLPKSNKEIRRDDSFSRRHRPKGGGGGTPVGQQTDLSDLSFGKIIENLRRLGIKIPGDSKNNNQGG